MFNVFREIPWAAKKAELCKKFGITAQDCETIAQLDECGRATLSNNSVAEAWRGNDPYINEPDEYLIDVFITRRGETEPVFAESFYVYDESSADWKK